MNNRWMCALALIICLPASLLCQVAAPPMVRFHTNVGDMDVTLLPASAPKTVANFLNYVNRGAYNNSLIHRSVAGFIFQGGGFQLQNHTFVATPSDPPVRNEFSVSNTRGTLAMAKLGNDPNSATNQWFFNESNQNAQNLNNQNGGFTVFGRVSNAAGLAIMDKIAAVPVPNPPIFNSPFDQMPLLNYRVGQPLQDSNFVLVISVTVLENPPLPAIASGGIVTASGFGALPVAAPGSFIEIYGSNLAGTNRGWTDADFTNGAAPTSLDGVSVTVNGLPAFVNFINSTQVNVQVPANVPTGGSVPVVVSYKNQSSAPVMLAIKPFAGGLLAPPAFNVEGKQYVVAVHSKDGSFVSNGNIAGIPASPAVRGETLIFYGIGFGPVSPENIPIAGQVVQGLSTLANPVRFNFGTSAGDIVYAGLAPAFVGLYQFNVTVPMNAPGGDLALEVVQGGETIPQTLFIPVQN